VKKDLSKTCYLLFSTLSNPTRLAILEMLRENPKNVTELSKALNQEQSMVSHNLKPLVKCSLVSVERRWKEHVYSLNNETMDQIFKIAGNHVKNYCVAKEQCPRRLKCQVGD